MTVHTRQSIFFKWRNDPDI